MADTKQHTAEFEKCVSQVMEQNHEKSSAFAICTDSFQKAAKPIFVGEAETQKLHLFCESIKLEGNKVSGVAIHPRRIFHPSEDMTHVYLKKELEKAAPSLAGKPFGIDHAYILAPPNMVTRSWYCPEHEGVCFEGIVDDHIAQLIREKAFKGISIELDWMRKNGSIHYVNGVAAKNFELTSLHLLKQFPPGDPDAFCKLIEAAEKKLREQAVRYGVTRTEECILDGLEGGLSNMDIAANCGTDPSVVELVRSNYGYLAKKLAEIRSKLKEQLVVAPAKPVDEQVLELRQNFESFRNEINERLARIEGALGQVTVTSPPPIVQPVLASKANGGKVMKKMKEQDQNQEPKDEHGCIVGKEKWDPEKNACVPVEQPPAQESLKTLHSFLKQFKEQPEVEQCVLDGVALGLGNEEIAEKCDVTLITVQEIRGSFTGLYEALKKLREQQGNQEPEKDEHGCVIGKEKWDAETEKCVPTETMKEQQGETDEQKQFMAQCLTSGKSMEECAAEWKQKQAAQTESIVTLRKKLVEVEAQLVKMEKQQKRKAATWKEKYMEFYNSVKGKLPELRNWKCWTGGPQMYVQEMLKILREHAPDEKSKSQFKVP